jgi:hypothetical protein
MLARLLSPGRDRRAETPGPRICALTGRPASSPQRRTSHTSRDFSLPAPQPAGTPTRRTQPPPRPTATGPTARLAQPAVLIPPGITGAGPDRRFRRPPGITRRPNSPGPICRPLIPPGSTASAQLSVQRTRRPNGRSTRRHARPDPPGVHHVHLVHVVHPVHPPHPVKNESWPAPRPNSSKRNAKTLLQQQKRAAQRRIRHHTAPIKPLLSVPVLRVSASGCPLGGDPDTPHILCF